MLEVNFSKVGHIYGPTDINDDVFKCYDEQDSRFNVMIETHLETLVRHVRNVITGTYDNDVYDFIGIDDMFPEMPYNVRNADGIEMNTKYIAVIE